ncbi:hypothetical protein ABW21_db0201029 [Orbilia brochopaga]|nr:hypothetical protein ABW21_db0201029 [Drechslerella brochopaga]
MSGQTASSSSTAAPANAGASSQPPGSTALPTSSLPTGVNKLPWDPCYVVDPNGCPSLLQDYPGPDFFANRAVAPFLISSGKLINPTYPTYSTSGFWVHDPDPMWDRPRSIFISILPFSLPVEEKPPPQKMKVPAEAPDWGFKA